VRWSKRKPEAAARLEAARNGLVAESERVGVPTENLVAPDLVRRLCWDWQDPGTGGDIAAVVEAFLADGGARPWQRELVVPVLAAAFTPA
jgi:ribonuclease D